MLTINYDLSSGGFRCLRGGGGAVVQPGVCDIDAVDGQDAGSLCGLIQSLTIGLDVHQAVGLRGGERKLQNSGFTITDAALTLRTSLPGNDHWMSTPALNSTMAVQFRVRASPTTSLTGSSGYSLTL